MPVRPMLDDIELQHVQNIEVDGDQVLVQHGVPALEGDFLQRLGRRGARITLSGVLTGPDAGDRLKTLRDKFRAAEPVSFVADIATATRVDQVLIEEMGVRELAGKTERFEYAFTLREYTPPPPPEEEPPEPEVPEPPAEEIDENVGTLIVEVDVEGEPEFDFSRVTVTVEGHQEDETFLARSSTNRSGNVWTEDEFPAGSYTVTAVAADDEMSGAENAEVRPGETAQVTITLSAGTIVARAFIVHFSFDRSFLEPCMLHVLRQVVGYAQDHSDEKLVIVGHTDEAGSHDYNQSLSERRARIVFAALTFGVNPDSAVDEWNRIRQSRPTGELPSIQEGRGGWGTTEYQYILHDLGYYPGIVDDRHGPLTEAAVKNFQRDHQAEGLSIDGVVGDQTWPVLIRSYLGRDAHNIPQDQFLPNCENEILKWLGCGELMPMASMLRQCSNPAWRPNRRTEVLFVNVERLPCEVPEPVTFNLPSSGSVNSNWCLGAGSANARCCFLTRDANETGKWLVQAAEPGMITVRGTIRFEDGTPLANARYILIAPDGEYLHVGSNGQPDQGEVVCQDRRGRPNPVFNRTNANGEFSYPRPTPIGIYTLEIQELYIARRSGEPPEAGRGNVLCKRLDGGSDFDVVVCQLATTFDLQVSNATQVGASSSMNYLAIYETTGNVVVTAVFPAGTCSSPRSILWAANGGQQDPGNPLQWQVPRSTIGETTVTATLMATGETKSIDVYIVRVILDVDADRNGVVDEDEAGKNSWAFGPNSRGAIVLCNNDNDNRPARNFQIDNTNQVVDGDDDVADLAPLIIRRSGPLPSGVSLRLSVDKQDKLRVFDSRSASGVAIVGPAPLSDESNPIVNSAAADVELRMEAIQYPDAGFNGEIRLALILRDGSNELARDEVLVRVAPWVMASHLDVTEELYVVVDSGFNDAFVAEIVRAATAAGIPLTSRGKASAVAYPDHWVQDTMEIGHSRIPDKAISVALNTVNPRGPRPPSGCWPRGGLNDYASDRLLGPDYGLQEYNLSCEPNTFDSFGNLEVSPPVRVGTRHYRLGRIYYGRGRPGDEFSSVIRQFLEAQRVQSPFPIDTNWLFVGHVDEIISFIPSNVGNDFRMLIASTVEARRILTDLQKNVPNGGDLTLFTGKTINYLRRIVPPTWRRDSFDLFHERTIDEILGDAALMTGNDFCQDRLDDIEIELCTQLGLDPITDIIRIPSLFVEFFTSQFSALIPGMVNMLVITRPNFGDTQLLIPHPFGPVDPDSNEDALLQSVRDSLKLIGYTDAQIHPVNDFDTYHVRHGEVHCGTNSKRTPPTTPWWEQTNVV